jgi:magnesium chelatase family protein
MGPTHLRRFCSLDESGRGLMEGAIRKLGLSARAMDRVLKVARTIADLAGGGEVKNSHLAEAIQYRTLDRMS